MHFGPEYLFYFQDENFNFWKKTATGITLGADPYFVDASPAGWEDIAFQNVRNKNYKAVDRSVSIPLDYVIDGAEILKYIFYTFGSTKKVFMGVASRRLIYNPGVNYKFWYKQVFRGEVDWKEFVHDGAKVNCTCLEDGLPKFLKAADKTVFEIPFDSSAINVKYDGITLHQSAQFLVSGGGLVSNGGNHSVDLGLVGQEGIDVNIKSVQRVMLGGSTGSAQNAVLATNGLWFYYSSNGESIDVEWDFTLDVSLAIGIPPNPAVQLLFVARNLADDGTILGGTTLYTVSSPALVYRRHHLQGTATIPVQADSGLYLFMGINIIGSSGDQAVAFEYVGEGSFNITKATYRKAPTYVPAYRPQDLFDKLIRLATGNKYSAELSQYLNVLHKDKVITSGTAIRGLSDAVLKISLDMFFSAFDSWDSVGLIDRVQSRKVGFEQEDQLIDLTNIIDLPSPKAGSLKISHAKDLLFNELSIGFPEIRNDVGVINGKDEWNIKVDFSTDAVTTIGKLDKVSPIKASCYDQEGIRVINNGKLTSDYKNDNDCYVVHIEDTLQPASSGVPDHYKIDRSLNPLVTAGLREPATVFNLWFSPKRSVYRNGSHIRGRFFKSEDTLFKFRNSDKNKELVCDGIVEKANFTIGELDQPKVVPIYITFEAAPRYDVNDLLDINPLQAFRFPLMGGWFIGTMERLAVSTHSSDQQIELRGAWSNDYSKLIQYYGR